MSMSALSRSRMLMQLRQRVDVLARNMARNGERGDGDVVVVEDGGRGAFPLVEPAIIVFIAGYLDGRALHDAHGQRRRPNGLDAPLRAGDVVLAPRLHKQVVVAHGGQQVARGHREDGDVPGVADRDFQHVEDGLGRVDERLVLAAQARQFPLVQDRRHLRVQRVHARLAAQFPTAQDVRRDVLLPDGLVGDELFPRLMDGGLVAFFKEIAFFVGIHAGPPEVRAKGGNGAASRRRGRRGGGADAPSVARRCPPVVYRYTHTPF